MANLFIGININNNTRKSLLSMIDKPSYMALEVEVENLKILDSNTLDVYDMNMEDVISGNIKLVDSKIYTLENSCFQQLTVYSDYTFYTNKNNKYCCRCTFESIVAFCKNKYCKFKNSNFVLNLHLYNSYRLLINLITFEIDLQCYGYTVYNNYKDYKNLEEYIHYAFYIDSTVEELMYSLTPVEKGCLTFNNLCGVYTLCDLGEYIVINNGIEKVVLIVKRLSKKVIVIPPSVNDLVITDGNVGFGVFNLQLVVPRKNRSKLIFSIKSTGAYISIYISRDPLYKVEEYLKAFGVYISFY